MFTDLHWERGGEVNCKAMQCKEAQRLYRRYGWVHSQKCLMTKAQLGKEKWCVTLYIKLMWNWFDFRRWCGSATMTSRSFTKPCPHYTRLCIVQESSRHLREQNSLVCPCFYVFHLLIARDSDQLLVLERVILHLSSVTTNKCIVKCVGTRLAETARWNTARYILRYWKDDNVSLIYVA